MMDWCRQNKVAVILLVLGISIPVHRSQGRLPGCLPQGSEGVPGMHRNRIRGQRQKTMTMRGQQQ